MVKQGKYLGLPPVIGRSTNQVLGFIKERVANKIQGWKGKLLSQGGKEVLLKSVAMAMPSYAMSLFKLPLGICKNLNSAMSQFWWGGNKEGRSIHWLSWEKLSMVKGRGGMGFMDIHWFNLALLAKLIWRIITKPNHLMSQVLKSKYFPNSSIFNAQIGANSSWLWKSLTSALPVIDKGSRTNVGDGKSIDIWSDHWLPDPISGIISSS